MKTPTLFVMPLKEGKVETYKAFIEECMGPKSASYKDLLKRYGLNNARLWIHELEGKHYALFIHDMDEGAGELLAKWPDPNQPFDLWFDEKLRECYDVKDLSHMPPQPTSCGFFE
ncbi:MAG: hypothetical protein KDK63_03855 [Chlamydiia bacterium]|nr:hypothetical protein [Chlamydiia bacterium]